MTDSTGLYMWEVLKDSNHKVRGGWRILVHKLLKICIHRKEWDHLWRQISFIKIWIDVLQDVGHQPRHRVYLLGLLKDFHHFLNPRHKAWDSGVYLGKIPSTMMLAYNALDYTVTHKGSSGITLWTEKIGSLSKYHYLLPDSFSPQYSPFSLMPGISYRKVKCHPLIDLCPEWDGGQWTLSLTNWSVPALCVLSSVSLGL